MNPELIRIVDGIARDKNIEREQIYTDIEQAIASGLRKQFNTEDTSEFTVTLDRTTGDDLRHPQRRDRCRCRSSAASARRRSSR